MEMHVSDWLMAGSALTALAVGYTACMVYKDHLDRRRSIEGLRRITEDSNAKLEDCYRTVNGLENTVNKI